MQDDNTVLHIAVSRGNIDIVKILLSDDRFTEINSKDNVSDNYIKARVNKISIFMSNVVQNGKTALMIAQERGLSDVVEILH